MSTKRRSSQHVKNVDSFILDNYPIHGADFCAVSLKESLQYIKSRVHIKKVAKLKPMSCEEDMRQRIKYLEGLNMELRLENMKIKRGLKV